MKQYKKISVILILFLIIELLNNCVFGFQIKDLPGNYDNTQGFVNAGNSILKIILAFGTVASVVVLVLIGIKYMFGSVEEKADYKKTLLPYVIGAIFVFSSTVIAQIIYNVAKSI